MKIVCISDTHMNHRRLTLPKGDVLVHAGDFSNIGLQHDVRVFADWLIEIKPNYPLGIVFIAGNHDRSFDPKFSKEFGGDGFGKPQWVIDTIDELETHGIIYLENDYVEIEGKLFYGSPYTPDFFPEHWAFNMPRHEIGMVWDEITKCDVVITHGPMYGHGDIVVRGDNHVGCEALTTAIERIGPKYHVAGHIHEGYGQYKVNSHTTSINASVLNERYELVNEPIVIEL